MIQDFNTIERTEDKVFLCAPAILEAKKTQIVAVQTIIDEALHFAKDVQVPARIDTLAAILLKGAEGLIEDVQLSATSEAARLGIPDFVAESWRKAATDKITADQIAAADDIRFRYLRAVDGLPIDLDNDLEEDKGCFIIKSDAIVTRVAPATRTEIAPAMQKASDDIVALAKQVRALEMQGINAAELVVKYAKLDAVPDEAARYNDITFRHHDPGTFFDPHIDRLINQQAIQNLKHK